MRLAPLFDIEQEKKFQQGFQQGLQQGKRRFLENLMCFRFGELDEELAAICDLLLVLPPEERIPLILQLSNLSREELLARLPEQKKES